MQDTAICSICEKANELIRCRGPCRRYFHQSCANIYITDKRNWLCSDCMRKVHRCFTCHEYAPDNQLIQCKHPNCHRYYHNDFECIGDYILDSDISSFECPAHFCAFCKSQETTHSPIIHCSRCTKAYHTSCSPSTICPINNYYFVCIRHRFEDQEMPPLTMDILEQRIDTVEEDNVNEQITDLQDIDTYYNDYYKSKSINIYEHDDIYPSKHTHITSYPCYNKQYL